MKYNCLGKSGLKVSELSFGSWVTFSNQVDESLAVSLLDIAYEHGVNFFDNAEAYAQGESERIMGNAFKKLGWSRDSFIVSSKVFWGGDKPSQRGLSRKHIWDACHSALKRLQLEYLDLFFCHRPDEDTPVEETVFSMDSLVRQGKVCYWGTSEWSACQIMQAYVFAKENSLIPPLMEQPQYNIFHRHRVEKEYLRLYSEVGLGTTIWSPLASGLLTGKYQNGIPNDSRANLNGYQWLKDRVVSKDGQEKISQVNHLKGISENLSCSLSQLAIAWCLKNPHVSTVILGAKSEEQLEENLKSINVKEKLDQVILEDIDKIFSNKPEPEKKF